MTGLRRTVGLGVAACVAGALLAAPVAQAEYGPGAEPASAVGTTLGSGESRTPSVSDDGRYVVYDTFAPELLGAPSDPVQAYTRGLVRKDLRTGAVALVAPPQRADAQSGTIVSDGAWGIASISGDGRRVLFQTTEGLVADDRNGAPDVYVRDMDRPVTDANAYELVSALDGTSAAPAYASGGARVGPAGFGLSDDGASAVFFTTGTSSLPAGGAPATPAGRVFVRRLDTRRTVPVNGGAGRGVVPNPVLSGDGSAVAWVDGDAAAQVRLLPGEPSPAGALLWKRVDGGGARRVAGATDLEDPACDPSTPFAGGDQVTGPCSGPFTTDIGTDVNNPQPITTPPSISDDGRYVLTLSTAQRRPFDAGTARTSGSLYLADMGSAAPRRAAVGRPISMTGGKSITNAVLAGDGRHVALTADSVGFDGPRVIGAIPSGGAGTTDLWVADLAAGSIQRATTAPDGSDYHGPPIEDRPGAYADPAPTALAVDDEAHAVAFAARDGNLFVGDANGVPDVEVVRGATGTASATDAPTALPVPGATGAPVSAASFPPLVAPRAIHPVIGYPVVGRDGIARVTVRVPAAGALTGEATTRSGGRAARVARVTRTAKAASTLTLRFSPAKAIRKRLRARAVKATITIRYRPKAGAATTAKRTVTYPRRRAAR